MDTTTWVKRKIEEWECYLAAAETEDEQQRAERELKYYRVWFAQLKGGAA